MLHTNGLDSMTKTLIVKKITLKSNGDTWLLSSWKVGGADWADAVWMSSLQLIPDWRNKPRYICPLQPYQP